VSLDGSGLKLLNPGDANHGAAMPEHTRFFVDTTSRVDQAEYFCKHLLREARDDADMVEVNREQAQRGDRRGCPDGGEEVRK